jgi:hypothetical protein
LNVPWPPERDAQARESCDDASRYSDESCASSPERSVSGPVISICPSMPSSDDASTALSTSARK